MTVRRNGNGNRLGELRQRAEAAVTAATQSTVASPADKLDRLLHELRVHQVELEMQNEELKAARVQIEQGLARYTELFDFAPIGYVTLNQHGTVLEINHAAARLLGQPRTFIVEKRFARFVASQSRGELAALLARALGSGGREECEIQIKPISSGARHLFLSASAISSSGEPMVLLAFQDFTAKKAEAELLRQTEEALREANQRKDEFLATLSHELRNPLAPIRNSLYVLSRIDPSGEQGQRALAIIDRQAAHLTRLVDDLLDITRITRGKIQLRRERVELAELVRSTIEDHQNAFEASGVALEASLGTDELWISADRARVAQVLSNLLSNAEKFTPPGGRVTVSLEVGGQTVRLRVRDTGVGIPPEIAQHLFEPFAQAPQTLARSRGGLGLGLATAKGLVELHGGQIEIASEGAGQGTDIVVALPMENHSPIPGSLPA